MKFPAQFFDGRSAITQDVQIELYPDGISITGATVEPRRWSYGDLDAANPIRQGEPIRLKHKIEPAARLNVPPGHAATQILERAPHLSSGFHAGRAMKLAAVIVVGLVLVGLAGYIMLNVAPRQLAQMMPLTWREHLADMTEKSFVKDAKQCTNSAGVGALTGLATRVRDGAENPPDFSIRVFRFPFVNAFALPSGRIVLTSKLIEKADTPEEVAGVIAHELGHTALLHPEASLVRNIGLQIIINVVTGGSGGDTLGGVAGLLTVLQYSRNAEREADDYAVSILKSSNIDPAGLRRFFEKLNKTGKSPLSGKWKDFANMLSTHPGTDERIENIQPLPAGEAETVISDETWKALKKICS